MAAETVIPYDEAIGILVDHAVTATGNHLYDWNATFSGLNPVEVAERLHTFGIGGAVSKNGQVFFHYDSPYLAATVNDVMSSANSNLSKTYSATMNPVLESTIDATTGKVSMAQKVVGAKKFFFGKVVPALAAASAGISLGKSIDERLYNANPDFWDAHGMSTLNPQTWSSIASGNELGETLINFIFGIDGSGNTQAYMDEEAYAYLAQWLQTQGAFTKSLIDMGEVNFNELDTSVICYPPFFASKLSNYRPVAQKYDAQYNFDHYTRIFDKMLNGLGDIDVVGLNFGANMNYTYIYAFPLSFMLESWDSLTPTGPKTIYSIDTAMKSFTVNAYAGSGSAGNSKVYNCYLSRGSGIVYDVELYTQAPAIYPNMNSSRITYYTDATLVPDRPDGNDYFVYLASNGYILSSIDGMSNQEGATQPTNVNTWTTPQTTLQSLQNQYPDLWNNAVPITTLQPDGTTTTKQYIPVPLPNATSYSDTQPISGDQTQTSTQTTPDTMTAIKTLLTDLIATPTDNPPDTGSGSSPTPTPIASTASSLWAIYHPTQEQVDAFGAWLWSDNLITQIKALMFSPIDSVISLHKIYCTPIDMGESTIQLGYLNSGVPSNYVTQQYVYTSCGSVDVSEYFGNVFDYAPNTSINLYLPFIGIVPLDVDSVMRSTMHIVYGVDIITGDCLATVNIHRDGYNSVQYQYSGNCAVHYPLTAGNYMSLLSSSLGGAVSGFFGGAGAGGLAAVGGAVIGGASGAMRSGTDVRRSGNFSGNAGAMGGKIPYLIIERPQTKVSDNFEHYQGYPTNAYVTVGDCSGYVRASTLHTDGIVATDDEIDMIRSAFSQGVIV